MLPRLGAYTPALPLAVINVIGPFRMNQELIVNDVT
jgi:hypothetical protein